MQDNVLDAKLTRLHVKPTGPRSKVTGRAATSLKQKGCGHAMFGKHTMRAQRELHDPGAQLRRQSTTAQFYETRAYHAS